jgi:hypothetical protein
MDCPLYATLEDVLHNCMPAVKVALKHTKKITNRFVFVKLPLLCLLILKTCLIEILSHVFQVYSLSPMYNMQLTLQLYKKWTVLYMPP